MAYAKITATYEVTTPMYLGNATPSEPATRLREASFKGVLRFWWRALVWHKAYRESGGNEDEAVKILHRWEAELFGTASDTGAGNSHASPFRLRCEILDPVKGKKDTLQGNGWKYLKGQGLQQRKAAFAPGSEITAHLLLARPLPANKMDELLKALVALGLFGGIGARTRRGVGSVAIQTLQVNGHSHDGIVIPQTPEELEQALKWLEITKADCPQPPLAAFSRESRIDWLEMDINQFGCAFMNWRGYYEQTDCINEKSKPVKKKHPNFKNDHDVVLDAVKGKTVSAPPERAVFGLPHNYFYKSVYDKKYKEFIKNGMTHDTAKRSARKLASAQVNYESAFISRNQKKHERHSSPFLVHIHAFKGEKGIVQVFLPNKFVENKIGIKAREVYSISFSPNWDIIIKFMNYMNGTSVL